MGQVVRITNHFTPPQVGLIRRMNPDCSPDEFDVFLHTAASLGLDPLKKQIYCFVFSKDNPEKRRMSLVVGIDGFRAIADRSGNYRPDDRAPRFVIDPEAIDPLSNPQGLVSAEVTVYKRVQGDWWPVTAVSYWSEVAPLTEEGRWGTNDAGRREFKGTGKLTIDPKKDNWRKMPRLMLAKTAEAQAIRRGWPEDLSAIHTNEEMDKAHTLDLTATEIVEAAETERRLSLIGGAHGIMFDFGDGLERIELGKATDTIIGKLRSLPAHEVLQWRNLNREPLKEFWARRPADALGVKQFLEAAEAKAQAEAAKG